MTGHVSTEPMEVDRPGSGVSPEPLTVLILHNEYLLRGGEDSVLESEAALLRAHGDRAHIHIVTSSSIKSFFQKLQVAWNFSYSEISKHKIKKLIADVRPDVVHVHNFVPLLTPSVFDACHESGVPVVQTLHNFRYLCSASVLLRKGHICEKCLSGSHYHAVLHHCYRGSYLQSFLHARMLEVHGRNQTWNSKVDRFIAVCGFARDKYIEAGFQPERMVVKYNFLSEDMAGRPSNLEERWRDPRALYVGRLAPEKGVRTMIDGWRNLEVPLDIVGSGALQEELQRKAPSNVTFHGVKSRPEAMVAMQDAAFLVMPSEWFETCPMVLVEGMAHGLPILTSRLGGMQEIVLDGETGLLFEPGNSADLAAKVRWIMANPEKAKAMSVRAREVFEQRFSAKQNYHELRAIYETVIDERRKVCGPEAHEVAIR